MKRSIWVRLIAMILVISMLAAPVSAATVRGSGHSTNGLIGAIIGIIKDIIKDIIDDWFDIPGVGDPDPTEPPVPTTPEEPTAPSEPVATDPTEPVVTEPEETEPEVTEPEAPVFEQTLVEGHANTVNGNLLRGVTYTLSQLVAQEPQTAPYALRSTGYALNAVAEETTSISDTALVITTDDLGPVIPDGEYVIRYNHASYGSYMTSNTSSGWPWYTTFLLGTTDESAATHFTFTRQNDGTYTIQAPDGTYMDITGNNSGEMTAVANYFAIEMKNDGIWIRDFDDNVCVNALGADFSSYTEKYYGGYTDGTPLELYAVTTITEPEQPEAPEQSEGDLIYFPVTMFNYDQDVIRRLTNQAEVEAGLKETWEGLYFSGGSPSATEYTYSTGAASHSDLTWQQVMDGTYYADEACTNLVTVNPIGSAGTGYTQTTVYVYDIWNSRGNEVYITNVFTNVSVYTFETNYYYYYSNKYYPVYIRNEGNTYYVQFRMTDFYDTLYGVGTSYGAAFAITDTVSLYTNNVSITGYTLTAGGNTLATLDGTDLTTKVGMPLYTPAGETTVTKPYAAWNWWSYKPANNDSDNAQNKFYAGLVQEELVENELKFNIPEPGIFTFDPTKPEVTNDGIKDIYQNVGLPFVIEDGFYTFDSDAHGTYFPDTNGDGASDPSNGKSDKYSNLYFDRGNTQGWADKSNPDSHLGYGDQSKNLWAPYNTNANDTGEAAIDYHFGMRADIPFSMTSNGRIKSTDDNSDPITFEFQGDDDVWIFIDGHLVIDLGGIHNRLGARITFPDHTITYYLPESNHNTNPFGAFNLEGFELVQKLYDDASGEGALGQTRPDFSSQEEHKMTIFYLERGMGTSNCKIQFNLPMRDTLMVTKDASMSWSEKQDENDGDHDGTAPLTSSEQAAVDNIPFGFTLYKKEANATAFTPVANTNYFLQDQKGVVKDTLSTDANGHFYLKNGETAKFMTNFPKEGVTYYVVEDKTPDGFLTPDYKYDGETTWGMEWYDSTTENDPEFVKKGTEIGEHELPMDATENKSYVITAKGSIESIDSLEFICVNYMNAELPSPTALAYEDMIVIDYGLPVHIDPLANDLYRGETIDIVAWGDESLTLNEVLDEYGNAVPHDADAQNKTSWSGTQNFHSGKVTFLDKPEDIAQYGRKTFKYELNKQLTEVEVISYIIKVTANLDEYINDVYIGTKTAYRYALAKVYIAPATIMYYEENFSDMITFKDNAKYPDAKWYETVLTSGHSDYQEDGVVGDSRNHTYGTDEAYLTDSFDSNGTSRYGDTTDGAIQFSYTFTGTGTSIFARTSANTGHMQIKIYEGDTASGAYMDVWYRDTYWKDTNDTTLDKDGVLYNVPVYTNEDLDYGTYTVVCTIAKKGSPTDGNPLGAGNEFYLDGIRVMQPLNKVVEEEAVYNEETGELISPTVYDAMTTKVLNAYTIDGESNLDVVTLRQKLITDNYFPVDPELGETEETWPFVVLTDIDGKIIYASDYVSIGPKEEVYLKPGQKVTFSLKYWEPEGLKLYAGMKAPFGSALVKVGHDVYDLKNAADCYYNVTDNSASQVVKYEQLYNGAGQPLFNDPENKEVYLTEDGGYYYSEGDKPVPANTKLTPKDDLNQPYYVVTYTFEATENDITRGIVSLTNIKVVGSHEFTIVDDTNINQ